MATDLTQEFCALRDTYIEKQFGRLNDMQRQAVFTTDGPLLILAEQAAARPPCWSTALQTSSGSARPTAPNRHRAQPRRTYQGSAQRHHDRHCRAQLAGRMLRQNAVRSWNVMAITFTNKAAGS